MWTIYQKIDNRWFRVGVRVSDYPTIYKDYIYLKEADPSLVICINGVKQ